MVDILSLIGGGGGTVSSATLPLSITNGVLSISLAGYIPTTHEANNIASADVVHGQYDIETKTITLKNGSGVTAVLSVDNAGYLNVGANGVITANLLNAWDFATIKIADSMNVSRNLTASLTGQLVWNQSSLVDLNYLNTQLQAKQDVLTAGAGIFLSGATIRSYSLRWNTSNTPSLPTAIQELHWDGYTVAETVNVGTGLVELTVGAPLDMATMTWANTQLATKQNTLSYYSESVGTPTYYMYTDETASPALYLAWASGTYSNLTGYQSITLMVYHSLSSLPVSGQMLFSMELQAGTTSEVVLSTNDASWSNWGETKFSGLSNAWQTFTWQSNLYANGFMNIHMGLIAPGSQYTQAAGDIKLRNLRVYTTTSASATIASDLNVQFGITCVSLTQTSDQSIKQNIAPASLEELQRVFDAVSVKTYERVDIPGSRVGFVAQDIQAVISSDSKLQNIVNPLYSNKPAPPLLGVDYARLASTILWGVCKNQQAQIADLNARLKVLESKKRKY